MIRDGAIRRLHKDFTEAEANALADYRRRELLGCVVILKAAFALR
jgi:hypothetical protein